MDILAARPTTGMAFMNPLKTTLIFGLAFVLIAGLACAGTVGGFEAFPGPEPTMTLGGGDSLRIGADALETSDLQARVTPVLSRIDLTQIPEPPVYMLLGLGLLFCVQRLVRRQRATK